MSTATRATGINLSYRELGGGTAGTRTETIIPETVVECKVSLEKGGQEIWSQKAAISNNKFGVTRLAPNETIQSFLQQRQWEGVSEFFPKVALPQYVFAESAKNGLGASLVTAVEAAPVKK